MVAKAQVEGIEVATGHWIGGQRVDPRATFEDRSPIDESVIAEVWQELLGLDRVSVHDNFLDIGGHSLLAMRAMTKIKKKKIGRAHV